MTFSYPEVCSTENGGLKLRDQMIESITNNVLGNQFSSYNVINQALYQSLMGKHKVLLTEIPEILYRQIIASGLKLSELRDIFRFVSDQLSKLQKPFSYKEGAVNFLPHIFQAPKDLYMTAILKESFQAATSIVSLVGSEHAVPIKRAWIPPPNGINFTEATRVSERIEGETDEDLIEKHALLDSLLESRPWGRSFISNPFPYLFEDITKIFPSTLTNYVNCFRFHYAKYEEFKKGQISYKSIPSYKDRLNVLLEESDKVVESEKSATDRQIMTELLLKDSISKSLLGIQLKVLENKANSKTFLQK